MRNFTSKYYKETISFMVKGKNVITGPTVNEIRED